MVNGRWVLSAAWIFGMVLAFDRVDQLIFWAEIGSMEESSGTLGQLLADSWWYYWGFVFLAGAFLGLLAWLVGGWWYWLRVYWSGDPEPSIPHSRAVYLSASLVVALPSILFKVAETVIFDNYMAAWSGRGMWSSVLMILPFWSYVVSFSGVRAVFDAKRWAALLWFLILPAFLAVFTLFVWFIMQMEVMEL
jgi:hypothetical protein